MVVNAPRVVDSISDGIGVNIVVTSSLEKVVEEDSSKTVDPKVVSA